MGIRRNGRYPTPTVWEYRNVANNLKTESRCISPYVGVYAAFPCSVWDSDLYVLNSHLSHSFCLSISLSVYLSICLYFFLCLSLSVYFSVSLSFSLSLSVSFSICHSVSVCFSLHSLLTGEIIFIKSIHRKPSNFGSLL